MLAQVAGRGRCPSPRANCPNTGAQRGRLRGTRSTLSCARARDWAPATSLGSSQRPCPSPGQPRALLPGHFPVEGALPCAALLGRLRGPVFAGKGGRGAADQGHSRGGCAPRPRTRRTKASLGRALPRGLPFLTRPAGTHVGDPAWPAAERPDPDQAVCGGAAGPAGGGGRRPRSEGPTRNARDLPPLDSQGRARLLPGAPLQAELGRAAFEGRHRLPFLESAREGPTPADAEVTALQRKAHAASRPFKALGPPEAFCPSSLPVVPLREAGFVRSPRPAAAPPLAHAHAHCRRPPAPPRRARPGSRPGGGDATPRAPAPPPRPAARAHLPLALRCCSGERPQTPGWCWPGAPTRPLSPPAETPRTPTCCPPSAQPARPRVSPRSRLPRSLHQALQTPWQGLRQTLPLRLARPPRRQIDLAAFLLTRITVGSTLKVGPGIPLTKGAWACCLSLCPRVRAPSAHRGSGLERRVCCGARQGGQRFLILFSGK
ncbi:WD repeat-containing protein 5 isoform X2 [Meles meles]|uniref:WD repeat-containing protein 5 isoform X2 n=1 Tax=Meles meles TaxID=9662 RepID=UPI001E69E34F|nr:WD repeat-containing protein 5 isoform X2 [Meles meles]